MSPAIFLFLAAVAAQGDTDSFVIHNFRFASGEVLPELRLHYRTLGQPRRDAAGHVRNAVLALHGTGGSGAQFLSPQFAGELYGAGQPLDTATHYLILPDNVGHGRSSKPSDGLRARFPRYAYEDMVTAQYRLVADGLHVNDLLYQVDASRDYDPSTALDRITAPVLAINSADDFINPPELGLMERLTPRVKRARYVLIPTSERTRGHGTHTAAAVWKEYFGPFVAALERAP